MGRVETGLGDFSLAATAKGLCFLTWDGPGAQAQFEQYVEQSALTLGAGCERAEAQLAISCTQLAAFARGERRDFELALDPRGTPFQLDVWRALREIPFGTTVTYGELARRVGNPGGARAVGAANGKNPIPVVVPCHRVVAANGLGGFAGGLARKELLLAHEGARLF